MSEKIFCGSGKIVTTKYGDLTKLSFHKDDLKRLEQNLVNDWVNCVMKEKKEKKDGKPTHYLEVDNWKPEQQNQETKPPLEFNKKPSKTNKIEVVIDDDDDLPF